MSECVYSSSEVPERIIRHSQNIEHAFDRRFRVGTKYDLIYSRGNCSRPNAVFRGAIWHLCHLARLLLEATWHLERPFSEEQNCKLGGIFGLYHFTIQTCSFHARPEDVCHNFSTFHHFHCCYLKVTAPYRTDRAYLDTLGVLRNRYGDDHDESVRTRWRDSITHSIYVLNEHYNPICTRDRAPLTRLADEVIFAILASVAYGRSQEEFRRVYSMFYRTVGIRKAHLEV